MCEAQRQGAQWQVEKENYTAPRSTSEAFSAFVMFAPSRSVAVCACPQPNSRATFRRQVVMLGRVQLRSCLVGHGGWLLPCPVTSSITHFSFCPAVNTFSV